VKEKLKNIISKVIEGEVPNFSVEVSDNKMHGDYSTNVALILAKKLGKNPAEIADSIKTKIKDESLEKVEVANGFINFFLSEKYLKDQLQEVLKQKNKFGNLKIGGSKKTRPSDDRAILRDAGLKPKDLVGIPWMVAFALRADGWYLRSDIIWHKPNPMPESVVDRPTKSHEYVFLLTKQPRYYYDAEAIKETNTPDMIRRAEAGHTRGPNGKIDTSRNDSDTLRGDDAKTITANGRNRRSVWTVATSPYSGAHFATFPPALVEPMILAGTSQRGACPTCGAGWVRVIEDSPEYAAVKAEMIGKTHEDTSKELERGKQQGWGKDKARVTQDVNILGWRPACSCYAVPPLPAAPEDVNGNMEAYRAERARLLELYATLPTVPCLVLDPFAGTGTVMRVAAKHGRSGIGVELNEKYIKLADERMSKIQTIMQF